MLPSSRTLHSLEKLFLYSHDRPVSGEVIVWFAPCRLLRIGKHCILMGAKNAQLHQNNFPQAEVEHRPLHKDTVWLLSSNGCAYTPGVRCTTRLRLRMVTRAEYLQPARKRKICCVQSSPATSTFRTGYDALYTCYLCKFVKLYNNPEPFPRVVKYEIIFAGLNWFALWQSEELTASDLHTAKG